MKYIFLFLGLLASESVFSQATSEPATVQPAKEKPPAEVIDANSTLRQRFQVMKAKSQSYNDYKVIKETVLDGVWKITTDSVKASRAALGEANAKITSLQKELESTQKAYQEKEASVADITFAGTHISVLGIQFDKATFITIVAIIIAGLVAVLAIAAGRLKMMHSAVKEKDDLFNATTLEFEDYKRKALDKQTKLSRELQNERNKLTDIKRSS